MKIFTLKQPFFDDHNQDETVEDYPGIGIMPISPIPVNSILKFDNEGEIYYPALNTPIIKKFDKLYFNTSVTNLDGWSVPLISSPLIRFIVFEKENELLHLPYNRGEYFYFRDSDFNSFGEIRCPTDNLTLSFHELHINYAMEIKIYIDMELVELFFVDGRLADLEVITKQFNNIRHKLVNIEVNAMSGVNNNVQIRGYFNDN